MSLVKGAPEVLFAACERYARISRDRKRLDHSSTQRMLTSSTTTTNLVSPDVCPYRYADGNGTLRALDRRAVDATSTSSPREAFVSYVLRVAVFVSLYV
jgi:hypothetical protein